MNNKIMRGCMLCLTIAFLVLGFIYRSTADNHKGVTVSTGVMVDGQYSEISSGKMGANEEKDEGIIRYKGQTIQSFQRK